MSELIHRALVDQVMGRLRQGPHLLQVVVGPRQVGKSTAAQQVAQRFQGSTHLAAADSPIPHGPAWVRVQWEIMRRKSLDGPGLLILDEIQKIQNWSEAVKELWDEEQNRQRPLEVMLLGSSALLLTQGLTESLAGRFFLHRCFHWSYPECRQAFGISLDEWIFYGGYPRALQFLPDEEAWRSYVVDSLIETVLARDVLAMQSVAKPALLRNLFILAAHFPAEILSYNKMLGQLTDAGNTTTLAHYLKLFETAFLLSGLQKFSGSQVQQRASKPKLILWNNALCTSLAGLRFAASRDDSSLWGRLCENAVGAHLLNGLDGTSLKVSYFREKNLEVDFVVHGPKTLLAIAVKSGRVSKPHGLEEFCSKNPKAKPLIVGPSGMAFEEFFSTSPRDLPGIS